MWRPPDPRISTWFRKSLNTSRNVWYKIGHNTCLAWSLVALKQIERHKHRNGCLVWSQITLLGFSGALGSDPTFRLLKIQSLVQERSQWKWMKEMVIKVMMIKSDNVKAIQRRYTCRHNIFGGSSEWRGSCQQSIWQNLWMLSFPFKMITDYHNFWIFHLGVRMRMYHCSGNMWDLANASVIVVSLPPPANIDHNIHFLFKIYNIWEKAPDRPTADVEISG